jgi:hypothetical protein
VVGGGAVADVLGALEHPEGQGGEEVPSGQQSGGGSKREASVLLEEVVHVLQLRNCAHAEDTLLLEHLEHVNVLLASVLLGQLANVSEHGVPGVDFSLHVFDVGNGVAELVSESDLGDHLAASAVLLVGEAGVVHVQLGLVLGHKVVAVVQLAGVTREPGV